MKQELAVQQEQVSDAVLTSHLENLGLLKDLTKGEKDTYMQICRAYNLNPFKREIHVSKYNGTMNIITGYETYIKRAERSGQLDGWEVKVEGSVKDNDLRAVITIFRKDRSHPFVWQVAYNEYVQKTKDGHVTKFWQKAETMIKKVAMAQGFRLCFNDELGGMPYTSDEMPEQTQDIAHEVVDHSEELASYIADLDKCETKKDLTDFKKIVPAYIISDASFVEAGKARYNVIMAEPTS